MPNLSFRSFIIRHFDVRRNEGGVFTRLHVTSDPSDVINGRMDWEHIPDSVESCKLSGKLAGESITLSPTDKSLAQYEIQLPCGDVGDFSIHRVQADEGDSTSTELRFVIRTASIAASASLSEYWSKVGDAPCAMKLRYSEQSEIEEKAEETEPETNAEPTQISMVDGMKLMSSGAKPKRDKTRGRATQLAQATASVEIDPTERQRLEAVIEESLQ